MKSFTTQLFSNARFKSFFWRGFAMLMAGGITYLGANLDLFNLAPQTTVIIGLILGEITKALNNSISGK